MKALPFFVRKVEVHLADDGMDGQAVIKPGVPVRPPAADGIAIFPMQLRVLIQQGGKCRSFADIRAILMPGEDARLVRGKTAKVKERQRPAVDKKLVAALFDNAGRNIPVGHVVCIIAQNDRCGKKYMYEIDPFLIRHQTSADGHETTGAKPPLPPAET